MSAAGDGEPADETGASSPPPSTARHRVPPTASAAAPVLPPPFTPDKPTIPAVPHQRRPDGPTAVAWASVPEPAAVPPVYTPRPDDPPLPAPFTPAKPSIPDVPHRRRPDGPTAMATAQIPVMNEPEKPEEPEHVEFIVNLPGLSNETVETVETVEGELLPVGMLPADDSPTVADYEPPALAIVAEEDDPEDAEDYRGTRRRSAPWRRLPIGAVAVAVLILLITGAVVFQVLRSNSTGGGKDNGLPGRVPGVSLPPGQTMPAGNVDAGSPSPTATPTASASRSRAASAAASHSPSAASVAASSAGPIPSPPAIGPPTSGNLLGKQSGRCIAWQAQPNSTTIALDNCGGANQRWRIVGDASAGATLLTDAGKCLDVQNAGTDNGNAVQVFACNGTPAQKWVRHPDNTWENTNSHRCLDAANANTGVGTPLIIWDCKASDNQIWSLG